VPRRQYLGFPSHLDDTVLRATPPLPILDIGLPKTKMNLKLNTVYAAKLIEDR
jgi:hypothetical protein